MSLTTVYEIAGHTFHKDLVFGWCADNTPITELVDKELDQVIAIGGSNPILLGDMTKEAVDLKNQRKALIESAATLSVAEEVKEPTAHQKAIQHNIDLILTMSEDGTIDGEKYFLVSKDENDLYTITGHGGKVRSSGRTLEETAEYLIEHW